MPLCSVVGPPGVLGEGHVGRFHQTPDQAGRDVGWEGGLGVATVHGVLGHQHRGGVSQA